MGELRLRQPQSRVVPLVDGPSVTSLKDWTEAWALLAPSKERGGTQLLYQLYFDSVGLLLNFLRVVKK